MTKYKASLLALLLTASAISYAQETPISEEVKQNIKTRVDNGTHTGIVVGVITSDGVEFYNYGVKSLTHKEEVDEYSVFEIGSISKTFTGVLLADKVVKKELKLDDPLQSLLPDGVKAPMRNGESIRLYQMSNHTSSLPRLPNNFSPTNPANPYADYTEDLMFDFLSSYELPRDIGSKYEYSNYAVGLLGNVLASSDNMTYEELMIKIIAEPLGMKQTTITLTPKMRKNLAMGHDQGQQVENWDLPTLAGAGAIRSTAVDMLKYVAANMGIEKSDLYSAMQLSHQNSGSEESEPIVGLGWHIMPRGEMNIVWHNGSTAGYSTFTGFVDGGDRGVVVLSNSSANVDDIGVHLLDATATLVSPKPSIATELKNRMKDKGVDELKASYWDLKKNQPDDFDYSENELNDLGYYYLERSNMEAALAIFQINVEAFPSSSNVYDSYGEALMKNGDNEGAIVNFKKSVEINPANANGIEMLKKLGVDTDDLVATVVVDDAVLESYVGQYELAPGFIITISKNGTQMMAKATGQGMATIFPKSQNEFFLKVVDAQLRFNLNDEGQVESVTLFQGGRETTGKRMSE